MDNWLDDNGGGGGGREVFGGVVDEGLLLHGNMGGKTDRLCVDCGGGCRREDIGGVVDAEVVEEEVGKSLWSSFVGSLFLEGTMEVELLRWMESKFS